jgi:hypothetical protein
VSTTLDRPMVVSDAPDAFVCGRIWRAQQISLQGGDRLDRLMRGNGVAQVFNLYHPNTGMIPSADAPRALSCNADVIRAE